MECASSPSPAQMALALAIVKLKPIGVDIKEYILQTRKLIKTSITGEIFYSPEKFFDSVSFWRQAYEKSEVEQSKLLDRIFELEERNEELAARLHPQEETPTKLGARLPLKRKDSNNNPIEKQTKKRRHNTRKSPPAEIEIFYDGFTTKLDGSKDSTSPFVRQSYILQKALQKRNTASIAQAAVILCKACGNELMGVVPQETLKDGSSNRALAPTQLSHFCLTLRCIESSVKILLLALIKLSNTRGPEQEEALVIYHIVCLYEAAINTLKGYCKTILTPAVPAGTEYPIQTRKKTSNRTNVNAGDERAIKLTSLLSRMTTSLDLTCPRHRRLLEGFLYILLNRAGKVLCVFVFQDLGLQPDLQADFHKLPPPAGLINAELDSKSLGATETEARYLIWLLQRTLAVVDTCPSLLGSESPGSQVQSNIKARLQSILVQAVFGEGLESERSLEPPIAPEGFDLERFLAKNQTNDLPVPEWYIQQVWELLGGDDILIKNNFS